MIEDVNNNISNRILPNETGNNQNITPSFRGNPNAVDTTPTSDTYQPQAIPQKAEDSGGMLNKAAYIIPTWFVLNTGTNMFNKACGGEYDKSLVGRLGRFGDMISETPLIKNSFVDNLKTYGHTIKNNLQKFIDKHPMLSAMQKNPTKAESSFVVGMTETQFESDAKEASSALREFIEKSPKSLKEAGATKEEIKALKAKYGTDLFGRIKNSQNAVQEFQLKKLGGADVMASITPETNILAKLKELKLKAVGLSEEQLAYLQKNPVAEAGKIEQALEKCKGFSPKISENLNKLKSARVPKSALGKFLPKLAKLAVRGLTFGGGTFNTLFIAFMMAGTVKNAFNAPKDKRKGTIANGLVDNMSWVVTMPLGIGAMHAVNGIKNTGYSVEDVGKYKSALKEFNEKVRSKVFKSETEYNAAKQELEKLLPKSASKDSILTKGMRKIAKFLSIGLEQKESYKEATKGLEGSVKMTAKLGNIKRAMPNFLRNCAGYPLRFGLYMFVFAPIVEKLFSGITNSLFGKAWEPEEEKEKAEKEAQRRAELYQGPAIIQNPAAIKNVGTADLNTLSDKNLIKQTVLGVKPSRNGYNNSKPDVSRNNNQFNPNESEYDTVPRSYIPNVDLNHPIKYSDPMANPYAEKNYNTAQALAYKSDIIADDVEKFLNE